MLQERAAFIRGSLKDTVLLEECEAGDSRPLSEQEREVWQALLSETLDADIVGGLLGYKMLLVPSAVVEDDVHAFLLIKGISNTKWHVMDVAAAPSDFDEPLSVGEHQWLLVLALTYRDATGDTPAMSTPPLSDEVTERVEEIKPSFKIRDAIPKLSSDSTSTEEKKKLLMGIHEKFWHATAKDMTNLLKKAGLGLSVLNLVPEVVRCCPVCRNYARPLNVPTLRAEMANFFNDILQVDIFFLWDKVWLLIVDEATRYKVCGELQDRSAGEVLSCLLRLWFRVFGPCRVLTSDQEGSLSGDHAGAELERLSIIRRLKGSDPAGRHTGTGLAERHIGLTKLAMLKIKAECDIQGLIVESGDIAYEAAMAQNLVLEYGGVTPAMAVFGRHPRGFSEFEDNSTTFITGAADNSVELFEQALRLRSFAVQAIHRCVVEDRLARASHARTQQHDLAALRLGSKTVDVFRPPQVRGESGWRGPADLLQVDVNNGTAVIIWQGRPYLLPLRHVRCHLPVVTALSIFAAGMMDQEELIGDMISFMDLVDNNSYGKLINQGLVYDSRDRLRLVPTDWKDEATTPKLYLLAESSAKQLFGLERIDGLRCGTALKKLLPVVRCRYSLLVSWQRGLRTDLTYEEIEPTKTINLMKRFGNAWENTSCVQLYVYQKVIEDDAKKQDRPPAASTAPSTPPAPPPRWSPPGSSTINVDDVSIDGMPDLPDKWLDFDDMDFDDRDDRGPPPGPAPRGRQPARTSSMRSRTRSTPSQRSTSTKPSYERVPDDDWGDPGQMPAADLPRPPSRPSAPSSSGRTRSRSTVRFKEPEAEDVEIQKGQADAKRPPPSDRSSSAVGEAHGKKYSREQDDPEPPLPPPAHKPASSSASAPSSSSGSDLPPLLPIQEPSTPASTVDQDGLDGLYALLSKLEAAKPNESDKDCTWFALPGPWQLRINFYMSLRTGKCFRVDQETANLTDRDLAELWPQVEAGDRKELESFVTHDVFQLMKKANAWTSVLDAIWVRKKKRQPDGSLIVKCRLCIRGFLDPQKWFLPTRATTASRMSQRMLLSIASLMNWQVESLDVGNAFLQGFSFEMMIEALKKRGLKPVENRQVLLEPPANVWRHFRNIKGCKWRVEDSDIGEYLLRLIKAMYGLNDAPLAWQMCVSDFLSELSAKPSIFDENLHLWFQNYQHPYGTLVSMATVHVDDNGIAGPQHRLDILADKFEKRFGKIQRQTIPFVHCGVRYTKNSDGGFTMDQREFCEKLTVLAIPGSRRDDEPLAPKEITLFRSQLGALLWLCVTRPDIVSDVSFLQQEISAPNVGHLRATNIVVKKAKQNASSFGIRFPVLRPPLKIAQFTDASHATKTTSYAMEGIVTLLMEDHEFKLDQDVTELSDGAAAGLSGYAHLLAWSGRKAKRISYSTSHAEALAICAGKDIGIVTAMRLTEMLCHDYLFNVDSAIKALESGKLVIPIDQFTDCNDAFENIIGTRALPTDKAERLYVQSMREERTFGCLRHFFKVPGSVMVADCLTKVMKSISMANMLNFGWLGLSNEEKQKIRVKKGTHLARRNSVMQKTLIDDKLPTVQDYIKENLVHWIQ